jgi:chorismate synthase
LFSSSIKKLIYISGESHGPQLTVIVEGVPANLEIKVEDINKEMFKRQGGYGCIRRPRP